MADPVSNKMFPDDFAKFVFQPNDALIVPPVAAPIKPFSLKKAEKSKKKKEKEQSPWEVKKPDKDSKDSILP